MLRIALVVILFLVALQTGSSQALCCDEIRSDIENRTLAYNLLCSKHDPHLGSCCRVIERNIRKHKLAYSILCPNNETDRCKSNPCGRNAICVSHSNHYTCTCKPGYTGSGTNCTKIDPCASNPCDFNAVCIRHSNLYHTCTCKPGYTGPGTNCSVIAGNSCADLYKSGVRKDGVYTIDPDGLGSFQVSCDMSTDRGGWTVFQRRQDGSQDFFLGWSDYKAGFGDLNGEFWLGLDKIHRLTKSGQNVLRVDLMDFDGAEAYAKYGKFSVADESEKYRLTVGNYSGDAGDSLGPHNQMQFSTKDSDNDAWSNNCATRWKGAWWYKWCHSSNLNGLYLAAGQNDATGITWYNWKNSYYSMKKAEMKIRPNQF